MRIKMLKLADKASWDTVENYVMDPFCDNNEDDRKWKKAVKDESKRARGKSILGEGSQGQEMVVMEEKVMEVIMNIQEKVAEVDLVDSGRQLVMIILEEGSLETKEGM